MMLRDTVGVENGEGSSSTPEAVKPDSENSSEEDDPVLTHSRDNALLNDDFLEDDPQSLLVSHHFVLCLRY